MEERPRERLTGEFFRMNDFNISPALHCRFCRNIDRGFLKKYGNLALGNFFCYTMKYKALVR